MSDDVIVMLNDAGLSLALMVAFYYPDSRKTVGLGFVKLRDSGDCDTEDECCLQNTTSPALQPSLFENSN